jgi:putative exosortase-associated protein (TIGR04073 family)
MRELISNGSGRKTWSSSLATYLCTLFMVLSFLVFTTPPASAATAGDKALRGLANILTGVMALPGEIHKEWNAQGPANGLTVGFAKGLGMIVARELLGVFELVSSPAPWPKSDFSPILQPQYPWGYFEQ